METGGTQALYNIYRTFISCEREIAALRSSSSSSMISEQVKEIRRKYNLRSSKFTYGFAFGRPVEIEVAASFTARKVKIVPPDSRFNREVRQTELLISADEGQFSRLSDEFGIQYETEIAPLYIRRLPRELEGAENVMCSMTGEAEVCEASNGDFFRFSIFFTSFPEIEPIE